MSSTSRGVTRLSGRQQPTLGISFLFLLIAMTFTSSKALAGVDPPVSCSARQDKSLSSPPSVSASTVPPQSRTFYRRVLPDSCVALSSPEGKSRFAAAMATQGTKSFFPLIEQFTTQSEPAFCGVSTLVIILNTLAIDPRRAWKGPWRWYEDTMLNCCLDPERIKQSGITINDFRCLAICQGLTAKAVLVEDLLEFQDTTATDSTGNDKNGGHDISDKQDRGDDNKISKDQAIDEFRRAVKEACTETDTGATPLTGKAEYLVVSYNRKVLGQTGSGHFSPIAAYDKASDSVLILDTARFKYGAHWVSLSLLFEAMIPKDPDTGKSRGYILLSDREHDTNDEELSTTDESLLVLPSVLFRSQRKQNPVRRDYKEFLAKKKADVIEFDDVATFWTKDRTTPGFIWKMLEPQLTPLREDKAAVGIIDSVRQLITTLLNHQVPHKPLPQACCDCRVNYSRTIDLTPREAIFVVYLASLDDEKRKEIVFSVGDGKEASPEKTQLLAEAELILLAIEMCDETCQA